MDRPVSLHFRRLELLPSDAYRTNHTDLLPSAVVCTTSEDLPLDAHRTNHTDLLPSAVVCTTSEDLVPTQGKYRGADTGAMEFRDSSGIQIST
jgi:hypothetical protein